MLIIWFIMFSIILIVISCISWRLCSYVIAPKGYSAEDILSREYKDGSITRDELDSFNRESFSYTLHDRTLIRGEWLHPEEESKKVMIICHGYLMNHCSSYKYARLFLQRGYHVLLYDQRHWGLSKAAYDTMGYKESDDLSQLIDYVYDRFQENCEVATHGESMGAATVLINAAHDNRVRFVVADCPFSDLQSLLYNRLKYDFHLTIFPFYYIASFFSKIRTGHFFGEVSPYRSMVEANGLRNIPVLFIHGSEDELISSENTKKLVEIKQGDVALYICEGAAHAKSYITNPTAYDNEIEKFLSMIGAE